jgi:cell division septation protein DedD
LQATQPVASKPAEKPAEASKPVAQPTATAAAGVGFAVQIGAFGNTAQANGKRDQLRAAGFSAFTETVNTSKGTLTRVLAGPVVSRADADALKARVKARLGIDGMVRSHP